MIQFESLLVVVSVAVGLAAVARRVGAPYPAFLALGGACLALTPYTPTLNLEPDLALALFVAPVLLDAAFDASPRDLWRNWVPLTTLVIGAVLLTTAAVAWVAHALVPAMPWAVAIALGAIVAPPDAAAATAILSQVRVPHRVLVILGGESLLNDATALLIYRLAIGAVAARQGLQAGQVIPTLLLAVVGSMIAGPVLAHLFVRLTASVRDIPTAIIIQFVGTFGVWVIAERLRLSPVLTVVAFAVTAARHAPAITSARMRLPSYAVWETAVFLLNVAAFLFIGLQMRPILAALDPVALTSYLTVAGAVVGTVIVVRMVWVLVCTVGIRWGARLRPATPRVLPPPRIAGGVVVGWSGMRGIVTLAAALALPAEVNGGPFPFRDLVIVTSFCVVLGTLVVQGLTLKALLNAFDLSDGDPVGHEVANASSQALKTALDTLSGDAGSAAAAVREELQSSLGDHLQTPAEADASIPHDQLRRRALAAARKTVLELRHRGEIGDDAFHIVEENLDHLEISNAVDPDADASAGG